MSQAKQIYASFRSIGAYVPKKILSNADLEKMVDTTDEWIVKRTGIKERHIAAADEFTSDMGVKAAQLAIDRSGVLKEDIDLILCATVTPDYFNMPSTACIISDKLDINVWELIELANHHPRVNILQPGAGVGGHCIAVDPWFIVNKNPDEAKIIRTAREINDYKPNWVIGKIKGEVDKLKKQLDNGKDAFVDLGNGNMSYFRGFDANGNILVEPAMTKVKDDRF